MGSTKSKDQPAEINVACCSTNDILSTAVVQSVVLGYSSPIQVLKEWKQINVFHRLRLTKHFYFLSIPSLFWIDYIQPLGMINLILFAIDIYPCETDHHKAMRKTEFLESIQVIATLAADASVAIVVVEVSQVIGEDEDALLKHSSILDDCDLNETLQSVNVIRLNIATGVGVGGLVTLLQAEGKTVCGDGAIPEEEDINGNPEKLLTWKTRSTDCAAIYYENNKTGRTTWTARDTFGELPANWEKMYDAEEKESYWFNCVTNESRWTRPSASNTTATSDATKKSNDDERRSMTV